MSRRRVLAAAPRPATLASTRRRARDARPRWRARVCAFETPGWPCPTAGIRSARSAGSRHRPLECSARQRGRHASKVRLEERALLTVCRGRAASAQTSIIASHPSAFFVDGEGWFVPSHSARILPFDTTTRDMAGIGDCQLYDYWTRIEGYLHVGNASDVWERLWTVSMMDVRGSYRHAS